MLGDQGPGAPLPCPNSSEERVIRLRFRFALDHKPQLAGVIIAPHGRFSAGDLLAGLFVVPAVGLVIDGVENQTLVSGIG